MIRSVIGFFLIVLGASIAYGPGYILGKLGWDAAVAYWGGRDPTFYSTTFMMTGSGREISGIWMYGILAVVLMLGLAAIVFGVIMLVQKLRSDG